jgi:Protein of unknown function (DUF3995)
MQNIHERTLDASTAEVWALVASLATENDRLWPRDLWPPMRLDRGLDVGSSGGHGSIRYKVESHTPEKSLVLRFDPSIGLTGVHRFDVTEIGDKTTLRHTLDAEPTGAMRVIWPLAIRRIHDAVVEDAFDTAAASLRNEPVVRKPKSWGLRQAVRLVVPHKPDRHGQRVGTATAATLAAIGGLHFAWGLGSSFPAPSRRSLARAVIGANSVPSATSCASVAGLLGAAATLVYARANPDSPIGRKVPPPLPRLGVLAAATVLGIRGAVGLIGGALGFPRTTDIFRVLNLVVYSPLCIALAAAILRTEKSQ